MKPIAIFRHSETEGPGYFATFLDGQRIPWQLIAIDRSERVPERAADYAGLCFMGGPMSVNDEAILPWLREEKQFIREAVKKGIPVLGVCLGAQLIASALGARIYTNRQKEIGWFPIEAVNTTTDVFRFPAELEVFHWHGETFDLPAGAVHLARSEACAHQAFQIGRRTLALQFHLEVTHPAARAFVSNCGDELKPAPFVQSAEQILAKPEATYNATNAWMGKILDYLVD